MGAHVAMLTCAPIPNVLLFLVIICICSPSSLALTITEALLLFKNDLLNAQALISWDPLKPPCLDNITNWEGLHCRNGIIWALQLDNKNLGGRINVDALATITSLQGISFVNNNFGGPIPEIKKLLGLKAIYLSNNKFDGDIPDDAFSGMSHLKKIYLENNMLSGKIPSSLAAPNGIYYVRLDGNKLTGNIPDFAHPLRLFNVTNNQLEGEIPHTLSNLTPEEFAGNKNLCGSPLKPCESSDMSSSSDSSSGDDLSGGIIALIVLAVLAAIVCMLICFFLICKKKRKSEEEPPELSSEKSTSVPPASANPEPANASDKTARKSRVEKLSFINDDSEKFELPDLLRASAEILGSGTFGSSYKAVLSATNTVVVKRFKHMNVVGREDFHEHMRRIGRLKHPRLLPLVAYYYRKEEKLLVCDFAPNGSLASHLHRNRKSENEKPLDWAARLRIVKGIARGVAYLHKELPNLDIPHGHLKSSNVLLDKSFEPLLVDYGLLPVVNCDQAPMIMVAYKSPEYASNGQVSRKSDVWSLGIMILEILTGKFPENYLTKHHDSQADLASWVNSAVAEKRTSEVFDKEMGGAKNNKSEMIKLLKIALTCCEEDPERRPEIREVFGKIEELKE